MLHESFNAAAQKDLGEGMNAFIAEIAAERPDLAGQPVYVPAQGRLGHALIIGDEVFKGPRRADLRASFSEEPDVLQALAGAGLPIPRVTYRAREGVFYAMTRVPGVALAAIYDEMSTDERNRLAEDLADFVIRMAGALPGKSGKYAVHGDLTRDNILIDPATRRLSGIIDFGCVLHLPRNNLCEMFSVAEDLSQRISRAYYSRREELPEDADNLARTGAKPSVPRLQ